MQLAMQSVQSVAYLRSSAHGFSTFPQLRGTYQVSLLFLVYSNAPNWASRPLSAGPMHRLPIGHTKGQVLRCSRKALERNLSVCEGLECVRRQIAWSWDMTGTYVNSFLFYRHILQVIIPHYSDSTGQRKLCTIHHKKIVGALDHHSITHMNASSAAIFAGKLWNARFFGTIPLGDYLLRCCHVRVGVRGR